MDETLQLLDLIGRIYDAAIEPALWPGVAEKSAQFVGGVAASLMRHDLVREAGTSYFTVGADPDFERLYFEKYIKLNPLSAAFFTLDVGDVTSNSAIIPSAEFFETRFYLEWVQPQGWIDAVFCVLEKSTTKFASFIVFRHERDGLADERAIRLLRLLTPHLRRAVLIGNVLDLKVIEAATFADTLDGFSAGMFLIDAGGRIVHANAAGSDILRAGDFLQGVAGRLVARDGQTDRILKDAFGATGQGDRAVGIKGIAVPLIGHDGERYVAHLLPLTSGARRRAGVATRATAALFVQKAAVGKPSQPEVIARTYKLTPTELRVLLALMEAGSGPKVAEALGVADGTVKTHLRHLFEKTGVNNQVDLVKLVAGFSSPFVG